MMAYLRKMVSGSDYRYSAISEPDSPVREHGGAPWRGRRRKPLVLAFAATFIIVLLFVSMSNRYMNPL